MEYISSNEKKPSVRIAHLWLFDSAGRLLICKRPESARSFPGVWTSSAGGHVEDSEEYKDAVIRETREELGISIEPKHAFLLRYDHQTHENYIDVWACEHSGEKLTADSREIAEMRFVSMEELANEMRGEPQQFSPEFRVLVWEWKKTARLLRPVGSVNIKSPDGKEQKYYSKETWSKPILAEADKKYHDYLQKIVQAKTQEGLKALDAK